jgi:hypothetical protein
MSDLNNKIDIKGDGSVVIYQRLKFGSPKEINKVFQIRIRISLSASEGILEAVRVRVIKVEQLRLH